MDGKQKVAVCYTAGGYKNVFTQGVLKVFEDSGFKASTYAGCSSSAPLAAMAAMGGPYLSDLSVWKLHLHLSHAMKATIDKIAPYVERSLASVHSPRLLIAVSLVNNAEAAAQTQGEKAKALGRKLVINAANHNPEWKDKNLELRLFDTQSQNKTVLLTAVNFAEVAYASMRVLHAWENPAYIDGLPYVDGCYTCVSPVLPLAALGYEKIICITNEYPTTYLDFFSSTEIPSKIGNTTVAFIKPDRDIKETGTDYLSFKEGALERAFALGYRKGMEFGLSEYS